MITYNPMQADEPRIESLEAQTGQNSRETPAQMTGRKEEPSDGVKEKRKGRGVFCKDGV